MTEPWATWFTPSALRGVRLEMGRGDLPETWAKQLPNHAEHTRICEIIRQHLKSVGTGWRWQKL